MSDYYILIEAGQEEIIEKKSRFIGIALPIKNEEEALKFIEKYKKEYWDARHHCYAYSLGQKNELVRFSDDGEPQQTAGKPILDVILGNQVHDILIIVIRYFGGTLLGTGGLVRAYSKAAKEALNTGKVIKKQLGKEMHLQVDYTLVGKIQFLIATWNVNQMEVEYQEKVDFKLLVLIEQLEAFEKAIVEGTSGQAVIEIGEERYFGQWEKELILFD